MAKTISFSVSDEIYDNFQIGFKSSGEPFFSTYIKKMFHVEELGRLDDTDIKVSVKDADIISYFLLLAVLTAVVKNKTEERSKIQSLPKHKKKMYEFMSDYTTVSFMRINELNNILNLEVKRTFGNEFDYNIQALIKSILTMIDNVGDRPVLIMQIDKFIKDLIKRKK